MTDLLLIETGSGGDLVLRGNDLASINGLENSPYLALFGGSDWWGNYLTKNPFIAKTEELLKITPLTSSGRSKIEAAINQDLSYLNDIKGTSWKVSTAITNTNRLDISIVINGQQFSLQWNPDKLFLTYKIQ